jgi:hypothetical protein
VYVPLNVIALDHMGIVGHMKLKGMIGNVLQGGMAVTRTAAYCRREYA